MKEVINEVKKETISVKDVDDGRIYIAVASSGKLYKAHASYTNGDGDKFVFESLSDSKFGLNGITTGLSALIKKTLKDDYKVYEFWGIKEALHFCIDTLKEKE
jgi:hypothetical protein